MRNRPIGSVSPQSTLTKLRPSISYSALAVLLAATLFYYPWAVWGLVPGQDSDLHYDYFHAFNDQLQRGEIYPRWLTTTNGGAGSPFFFQYPLPYFAAAALHYALNLPATIAGESHALGIVFFLAAVFLGASLYLWCSRLVDPPSAAAAAIAGLTLPYIWFDFYKRAGIGECIALACIPLAFYFCHDLIEKPRRAVAGIALCFFLMFISNVFTVVMFVPFLGLYVLALTSGRQALVALTLTGIGAALGAGLAGIYLLPLLFHHRYFDSSGFLAQAGGFFFYDNQLFPLNSRVLGSHLGWRFLSWLTLIGAVLVAGLAMLRWREGALEQGSHRALAVAAVLVIGLQVAAPLVSAPPVERMADWAVVQRSQIFGFALLTLQVALISFLALPRQATQRLPLFIFVAALASYLLMSRLTTFVWDHLHVLWILQFPWRFCGILSIFTTGLIAFLFQAVSQNGGWYSRKLLLVSAGFAGVALLGAFGWQAHAAFLHRSDFTQTYVPTTELFSDDYWGVKTVPETRIVEGAGSVGLQAFSARDRLLEADCSGPCTTQVRLFYYPAWVAHDASGAWVELQRSSGVRLMQLTLPGGSHRIRLELPGSAAESLGPVVSLLSLAVVLIVAFGDLRGARPKSSVMEKSMEKSG